MRRIGLIRLSSFFFFNDTATTEIYTLSLHDALPISCACARPARASAATSRCRPDPHAPAARGAAARGDRKSTRLNSSHSQISYAVFCLKKKNTYLTPVLKLPIMTVRTNSLVAIVVFE